MNTTHEYILVVCDSSIDFYTIIFTLMAKNRLAKTILLTTRLRRCDRKQLQNDSLAPTKIITKMSPPTDKNTLQKCCIVATKINYKNIASFIQKQITKLFPRPDKNVYKHVDKN